MKSESIWPADSVLCEKKKKRKDLERAKYGKIILLNSFLWNTPIFNLQVGNLGKILAVASH